MESSALMVREEMTMRWDLIESQAPTGEKFTARLAAPGRSTEVFIAVDSARRRYVLVHIPDGEPCSISERTSRGIAVQTVEMKLNDTGKSGVFVEIACLEQSGYAALDTVTLELVDALVAGASIGRVRLVQSVLTKWRRFWSGISRNLLSREQHIGLFGELWFLARWLLPAVGAECAVSMWRGPIGARNDFEQQGWAVEVKTSGKVDGSHQVHGLEQLLAPSGVELFLFSLLVREEASGLESLPKIIYELRTALAADYPVLSRLETMLAAAEYDDTHSAEYDKVRLRVRGQGLYRVAADFPRLIPESIPNGLPTGVSSVSYELRLDAAGQWLVGENPMASDVLLKGLANKTGTMG